MQELDPLERLMNRLGGKYLTHMRTFAANDIGIAARRLLSDVEYKIVERRLGLDGATPRTSAEISSQMGVSQDDAANLETAVVNRLSEYVDQNWRPGTGMRSVVEPTASGGRVAELPKGGSRRYSRENANDIAVPEHGESQKSMLNENILHFLDQYDCEMPPTARSREIRRRVRGVLTALYGQRVHSVLENAYRYGMGIRESSGPQEIEDYENQIRSRTQGVADRQLITMGDLYDLRLTDIRLALTFHGYGKKTYKGLQNMLVNYDLPPLREG